MTIDRRQGLKLALGAAAASFAPFGLARAQQAQPRNVFVLKPLPYGFDALEPHIDATTMMLHHDKHQGAYVANLNAIVERYPDLATKPPEAILSDLSAVPETVRAPVRNNLGGDWNHNFFWDLMTPGGAKQPGGALGGAINGAFGDGQTLITKVNEAALGRFGSGWAWLVAKNGKLDIVSTPNQDTPLEAGAKPILGVDVWEHAYYLKYQNRRADYLKAWWNVVNWDKASANFAKATG